MGWFTELTGIVAPFFIIASPILSYSDQALSMQRNKSSAGFSLDIPLIMLVASFLRIFYWPGARFDLSLLAQAMLMVGMQAVLLKIALDHRPAPSSKGGEGSVPFSGASGQEGVLGSGITRPYNFWQWRSPKPYWQFLSYFFLALAACEIVLAFVPPIYSFYSAIIGIMGLSIEATLPIPQILANAQTRSCQGFRVSVLASWLAGDAMKLFWFFTATTEIPLVFKVCGMFQASCDCFLGVQYFMYGEGFSGLPALNDIGGYISNFNSSNDSANGQSTEKEGANGHEMDSVATAGSWQNGSPYGKQPGMRDHSRSLTPTRRPAPFHDMGSEQ